MCRVRTRSKREASSQTWTRKTSHMLNIPYNFLNGFELISKMTRRTSQSAEIRRSAEKSHVWYIDTFDATFLFMNTDTNHMESFYCLFLLSKSNHEPFFFLLMFSSWTDRELLFWSWIVFKLNRLVLGRIVEHRLQGSQVLLRVVCCLVFPSWQGGPLLSPAAWQIVPLCRSCGSVCVSVGRGGAGLLRRGVGEGERTGKKGEKWGEGGVKAGWWGGGGKRRKNYRLMWWIPVIYF